MKSASAASVIRCDAKIEAYWSYDPSHNSSKLLETSDNLPEIYLNFDFGFLKLDNREKVKSLLFRQSAIEEINGDPAHIVIRYETTNKSQIDKTSMIISDPMCKNGAAAKISIFETRGFSYTNKIYNCECLSQIHDIDNFIN